MAHDTNIAELKTEIDTILGRINRPKKAVVTAGMPYANGPLHVGHLAGAHVPADIFARFMRMMIGEDNVLFVCGTDDHGSNSEVSAKKSGQSSRDFVNSIHSQQKETMDRYGISLNTYSGTSREELYDDHVKLCQDVLRKLYKNKMLDKKTSKQWYDPEMKMFLPDRFVFGQCPKCDHPKAYSDECDECGAKYDPAQLVNPKSAVSSAKPELKDTDHWYLNMWKVTDQLVEWLATKQKTWKKNVLNEVMGTVLPSVIFSNTHEPQFKEIRDTLPKHKSRYAPGKQIVVQFNNLSDLENGRQLLTDKGIETELQDQWAHRSITRDVAWGIPVPTDIDDGMEGKTFYVWPESLVAPISFSKLALKQTGEDTDKYKDYWTDPEAKVYQFLGIDNVFFYVLMQGSMWFGMQADPLRQPIKGELQLTDIFSHFHLQINGKKMSKSTGNFYTANQLLDEFEFTPDQVRYYLALLSLSEKASNFDFEDLKRRNEFLKGPMNASFEKPISACHSKFNGKIPKGKIIGKTFKETKKIVQMYVKFMERGEYAKALFSLENYARIINSLFAQYKPHDDRHPLEDRSDALYTSFYILKNILIMLHPIAPFTTEKLRDSLNLPQDIYRLDELGVPMPEEHTLGTQAEFF